MLAEFISQYAEENKMDPAIVAILAGVMLADMMKETKDYKKFENAVKTRTPYMYESIQAINWRTKHDKQKR